MELMKFNLLLWPSWSSCGQGNGQGKLLEVSDFIGMSKLAKVKAKFFFSKSKYIYIVIYTLDIENRVFNIIRNLYAFTLASLAIINKIKHLSIFTLATAWPQPGHLT